MCQIDDCERDIHATGLCRLHYLRKYREKKKTANSDQLVTGGTKDQKPPLEYDDDEPIEIDEKELRRQKVERAKWKYFIYTQVYGKPKYEE